MSFSFTIDDLPPLLVMLVLAAVLGWFADLLAGGRVPLGFFGAVLFGLLGAWVATQVVRPRIPCELPKEPTFDGVMLVTAAIGVRSRQDCTTSDRSPDRRTVPTERPSPWQWRGAGGEAWTGRGSICSRQPVQAKARRGSA